MPSSSTSARETSDLLATIQRVPAGYVSTHSDIARHLTADPRRVAHILATLDEQQRQTVPWWRVVADGGAIGRHALREEQMARLRADGVPVSSAGIAQELADRRVKDLDAPPAGPFALRAEGTSTNQPSRSRGMKSHPGSS